MNRPAPRSQPNRQPVLFPAPGRQAARSDELEAAVRALGSAEAEDRGAVYTKVEVVELILDLVGYTDDRELHRLRLVEPSFGGGDFLLPAVERLLRAWRRAGSPAADLNDAVFAVEISGQAFERTRVALLEQLRAAQVPAAEALADRWLCNDDFLLTQIDGSVDLVVGNPPYVRQERIPPVLLAAYRARYPTLYDRADLYVPFIERGLRLLKPDGQLGFICANRWQKNKYGGPLRSMVAEGFQLDVHIDLVGSPAFSAEVIAYPAITLLRASRDNDAPTAVVQRPPINGAHLRALAADIRAGRARADVTHISGVTVGDAPWLLDDPTRLKLLRRLEATTPVLEAAGCTVGIGVASGRDEVYIRKDDALDIEPERKLPLVLAKETRSGEVCSEGYVLANPYDDDGQIVDLSDWPRFAAYMQAHEATLTARNVAKRSGPRWYRTIDRVQPGLRTAEKLLIPDIKDEPHVVYEPGERYPHHNLYWVTSTTYELRCLQVLLQSPVARLFIRAYCVEMAGGFLRFQAQYLRRIPVPHWENLSEATRALLRGAVGCPADAPAARSAVCAAYGLTEAEEALLYDVHRGETTP